MFHVYLSCSGGVKPTVQHIRHFTKVHTYSNGNLHQSLHFGDDCVDNDSIDNDDGDYNMESELALVLTSNDNDGNAVDGELVSTFVITRWVFSVVAFVITRWVLFLVVTFIMVPRYFCY